MRIQVETHGHQHYSKDVGNVLHWGTSVDGYPDGPMQVPCVILATDTGEIKQILLTRYLYHTKLQVLST